MTSKDLDKIRARADTASPGPWPVRRMANSFESPAGDRHTHPCVRGFRVPKKIYELAWQQFEADAEFIGHSREDVPALLDEIAYLRSTLHDCREAIAELVRANPAGVPADGCSQIKEFLDSEEKRWSDGKPLTNRLHVSQPAMRPREAKAAVGVAD
jgi:hypothetical protein